MEVAYIIAFVFIINGIIFYFSDRNTRRKKAVILQQLQGTESVLLFGIKTTLKTIVPLGFSIQWKKVDVLFIANSMIYFSYIPFFQFKIYRGVR